MSVVHFDLQVVKRLFQMLHMRILVRHVKQVECKGLVSLALRTTKHATGNLLCGPTKYYSKAECDPERYDDTSGSIDERGRQSLTCSLCKKLLFDPITAPTGNSFCRYCLQRALVEKPVCPVTQKVIHMNARRFPVRAVLPA